MTFDPAVLGKALGARLREVEQAMERYGTFAFAPGDAGPPAEAATGEAAARDLVLRVLAAAAEPTNAAILRRLAEGDASLPALGTALGLPRLAVWERLNELVALGLAGRALERDSAGLTTAGAAMVELCDLAARAAASGWDGP